MTTSATPDAVVVLGTDITGFTQGIEAAEQALKKWGEGVLGIIGGVGNRIMGVWGKVGESLANPIGLAVLPVKALGVAFDGLVDAASGAFRVFGDAGFAFEAIIKGVYGTISSLAGMVPKLVGGAVDAVIGFLDSGIEAMEKFAERLAEMADMSVVELGNTIGGWGGSLAEWLAARVFSKPTASKIGRFVGEELGAVLQDVILEDVGLDRAFGGLEQAGEKVQALSGVFTQLAAAIRETKSDITTAFDNILRDARFTVRDIGQGFAALKLGDKLSEGAEAAFDALAGYADAALGKVEDFIGRTLVRLADTIDRAVERFRAPIAAALDFAQRLLEKIGLIDAGGARWGDSIRNAASVGEELILKVVGGVAWISGEITNLVGKLADLTAKIIRSTIEFMSREIGVDYLSESTFGQVLSGNVSLAELNPFGNPFGLGPRDTTGEAMREESRKGLRQDQLALADATYSGAAGAARWLEDQAKKMKAVNPDKWSEDAQKLIQEWMARARPQVPQQDLRFEIQRGQEAAALIKPPEVKLPATPGVGVAVDAVLAKSREAANLIARAQSPGVLNDKERQQQMLNAQLKQLEEQKRQREAAERLARLMEELGKV